MRPLSRTAFAALLLVPAAVLTATPAQAAVGGYVATTQFIGGGSSVNVRSAPSTTSTVVRSIANGTALSIDCQLVGGRLGFSKYADNRTWDRLSDGRYISDVVTTTPGGARTPLSDGGYVAWSPTIPQCVVGGRTTPPAAAKTDKAIAWARTQIGQPGWGGKCEAFVETAYGVGYKYYSAKTDYDDQVRAGRMHTDLNAPAGALVYYAYIDPSNGENLGHVAVSIGGGQAIGTFGGTGSSKTPQQHGISTASRGLTYLGWAAAPDAWGGRA